MLTDSHFLFGTGDFREDFFFGLVDELALSTFYSVVSSSIDFLDVDGCWALEGSVLSILVELEEVAKLANIWCL